MWNKIGQLIIRFRLPLIILIGLLTVVMGYFAAQVQMSYDFARTVPPNDPDMVFLEKFRAQFGEDGNIIAVGLKDSTVYQVKNFVAFDEFTRTIKKINGVNEVISL